MALEVEIARRAAKGGLRALIRQMCSDNPLWRAPRIHGELLKLGFEISQSTRVQIYAPPTQGSRSELEDIPPKSHGLSGFDRFPRGPHNSGEQAGSGQKRETVGTLRAAAICIGPVLFPINKLHLFIKDTN